MQPTPGAPTDHAAAGVGGTGAGQRRPTPRMGLAKWTGRAGRAGDGAVIREVVDAFDQVAGVTHEVRDINDEVVDVINEVVDLTREVPDVMREVPDVIDEVYDVMHEVRDLDDDVNDVIDDVIDPVVATIAQSYCSISAESPSQ